MAMKPLKTAHDMFYFVEDVMRILGYSKSKSYKEPQPRAGEPGQMHL